MTTERIDVLAVMTDLCAIRRTLFQRAQRRNARGTCSPAYFEQHKAMLKQADAAHSAVAELIEHAQTVAHYNKFTAAGDEYVEIPRATMDTLIAALARVGGA